MKPIVFVMMLLISCIFTLQASMGSVGIVPVTAKGKFWATQDVNKAQYEMELTVLFNEVSGVITDIIYTPSPAHSTRSRYHTRWTTSTRDFPGTYQDYINTLIGMKAEDVAKFTKPTGNARGGNHGITGLDMTGVDAVSGATENGRNFVSSVVAASQEFLAHIAALEVFF
jgi:hypothetical protein